MMARTVRHVGSIRMLRSRSVTSPVVVFGCSGLNPAGCTTMNSAEHESVGAAMHDAIIGGWRRAVVKAKCCESYPLGETSSARHSSVTLKEAFSAAMQANVMTG